MTWIFWITIQKIQSDSVERLEGLKPSKRYC